MSFFIAVCPECGERYMHLFVGSTLHSGHACPKARPLAFQNPQTPPTPQKRGRV